MMPTITSLFWIALVAVAAPVCAGLLPRRLVPEVVLLLVGGVLIGPYALSLAGTDQAIEALHAFGLGMLFLLAGYEIDLGELTGRSGRRALVTWLACLAFAVAFIAVVGRFHPISAWIAVAIALVSTSLGTLLPILRDKGLLGTPVGAAVMRHGAYGEFGPIIAMAVLLGSRGALTSIVVLALFVGLALLVALPSKLGHTESWLTRVISAGSDTTAQTTVRLTMLLLATLGTLAIAFDLDGILGAFAAGIVLRRFVPTGNERFEAKLDGLAFGFLIPVFFITSGMAIDPRAVASAPLLLVAFVVVILLARGVPVLIAVRTERDRATRRPLFDGRDSLRVALYSATGLPMIVAVTAIAVSYGEMTSATAAILVTGGAVTVLLLPLVATLLERNALQFEPSAVPSVENADPATAEPRTDPLS